ncbi:hypothetical protein V7075_19060, partial [Neobacillus drentensis]|uniref:hypothetical protein n=1 Tax=Neobacillus drentensis TaxID=220684 RepID=UPI0030003D7B
TTNSSDDCWNEKLVLACRNMKKQSSTNYIEGYFALGCSDLVVPLMWGIAGECSFSVKSDCKICKICDI